MASSRFPRVKAEGQITLSAIVVFTVFFYRKFTDNQSASTGHFFIGFFFTYLALGVIALDAPELAGMFALLIMTGDLLANGEQLTGTVKGSLTATAPATTTPATTTAKGG